MTDFTGWKQFGWNPPAFDPDEFRDQNYGQGHRLTWQKSMKCPCVANIHLDGAPTETTYTTEVKEARPDCEACRGRGILYFGEQEITAVLLDFTITPKWLEIFGSIADGGCLISPEPEHVLNRRDRLVDQDEVRIFDEVCVRTGAIETSNTLRGTPTYPFVVENITVGGDPDPRIPESATRGVIYMRRADSEGRITGDPLVYGTDFTVTDDGYIEWIDAGGYAEGYLQLFGDQPIPGGTSIPNGTQVAVGTIIADVWVVTQGAVFWSETCVVKVKALLAGDAYNLTENSDFIAAFGDYVALATTLDNFTGGADPGEGGNTPAVGERYAYQAVVRPTYIVRLIPRAGRTSRVSDAPYVNMIDGYKGTWDPSEGAFPSGEIAPGDYWEVLIGGEFADIEFSAGDYLVALIGDPSSETYAGNWRKMSMFGGTNEEETRMAHMPTAAMCWLEDMGDPFHQGGVA